MEERLDTDDLTPSDALCGERFTNVHLCRKGARVEFTMESENGNAFGGYLSPSLAAQFGRELATHAADAFKELRSPRAGR